MGGRVVVWSSRRGEREEGGGGGGGGGVASKNKTAACVCVACQNGLAARLASPWLDFYLPV